MAQQFDYPKTETQLREIQDKLYQHSKEVYNAGGRPAFKGLLEIMSAEPTHYHGNPQHQKQPRQ